MQFLLLISIQFIITTSVASGMPLVNEPIDDVFTDKQLKPAAHDKYYQFRIAGRIHMDSAIIHGNKELIPGAGAEIRLYQVPIQFKQNIPKFISYEMSD